MYEGTTFSVCGTVLRTKTCSHYNDKRHDKRLMSGDILRYNTQRYTVDTIIWIRIATESQYSHLIITTTYY